MCTSVTASVAVRRYLGGGEGEGGAAPKSTLNLSQLHFPIGSLQTPNCRFSWVPKVASNKLVYKKLLVAVQNYKMCVLCTWLSVWVS